MRGYANVKDYYGGPSYEQRKAKAAEGFRWCIDCHQWMPLAGFCRKGFRKDRAPSLHSVCSTCNPKRLAKWRLNTDPNRVEELNAFAQIKRNYGVSRATYEGMFKAQNGKCKICEKTTTYRLCVDHDHRTGVVRGLLCKHCNSGLGHFKDNQSLLKLACEYLVESSILRRVDNG